MYNHFEGHHFWWFCIVLQLLGACLYYFVHPFYISDSQLNNRNTSLWCNLGNKLKIIFSILEIASEHHHCISKADS